MDLIKKNKININNPENIFYCKKCLISNRRVISSSVIKDDIKHSNRVRMPFKQGICQACLVVEKKFSIDWKSREKKLNSILEKYRSKNGSFDCIVPGSGGKDSVFQAETLKSKFKMNPLTVTFSPHMYTDVGMKNFHNWSLIGGVHNFLYSPNGKTHSILTRLAFSNLLHPFQPFIFGQRHFGSHMAKLFNIKLIFMGESQAEAGGQDDEIDVDEMLPRYWTRKKNDKIKIAGVDINQLNKFSIKKDDIKFYLPLDSNEVEKEGIKILYLGNFVNLQPHENFYFATKVSNFSPAPERTQQTFSKYNSIDDKIDPFHYYTAYVKYGYGRCIEEANNEIRHGYISREEGLKLVRKYDDEFPSKYFQDFLKYIKISEDKFYDTLDRFRDPKIWKKIPGKPRKHCQNWKLIDKII
jgi:N-acetyl sugar amidotransferase